MASGVNLTACCLCASGAAEAKISCEGELNVSLNDVVDLKGGMGRDGVCKVGMANGSIGSECGILKDDLGVPDSSVVS